MEIKARLPSETTLLTLPGKYEHMHTHTHTHTRTLKYRPTIYIDDIDYITMQSQSVYVCNQDHMAPLVPTTTLWTLPDEYGAKLVHIGNIYTHMRVHTCLSCVHVGSCLGMR